MSRAGQEQILCNARIVLRDDVVHGSLRIVDGRIVDIVSGGCAAGDDMHGDYLIPGLIELHTDHLETHYSPRPGVRWSMPAAIQAHDAQIATAGITTVFDCLRVGSYDDEYLETGEMSSLAAALVQAGVEQRLRVDHRLHLRCEVSAPNVMDDLAGFFDTPAQRQGIADMVELISVMDHAPGQRQFASMDEYARYYQGTLKMSDEEFARFVADRLSASNTFATPNRLAISAQARDRRITLASHDDATEAHVAESLQLGVGIAEFPTSVVAARRSHAGGMAVLMGAPNLVRGGSHSGNVSARDLAAAGCLDILSSDYIPASLLQAAFLLAGELQLCSIPRALRSVSETPARVAGLHDRGHLAPGLRADVVRVANVDSASGIPTVRAVWCAGERVA